MHIIVLNDEIQIIYSLRSKTALQKLFKRSFPYKTEAFVSCLLCWCSCSFAPFWF